MGPLENKREKPMELGAPLAFATAEEAQEAITQITRGQGADSAILTVDLMTPEVVAAGFNAIGKGGVVVVTGLNKLMEQTIQLPGSILPLFRKTVRGTLFGDCNPTTDIPKLLGLYQAGDLKLDEIITRTYTLDEVNEGYEDLLAGKNVRGVVVHEHRAAAWRPARHARSGRTDLMPIQVVGRRRELELVRAALASGPHILIEGPPGTGKSTLLRQVAEARHTEFALVEGTAGLAPARLSASLYPALALAQVSRPP